MVGAATVSVLVTAYNRARFIGTAVASILGQSLADFELIVIDDGSTDETAAVVSAIGDPRIRLVRHERNRGIPAARNTGLAEAKGQLIAWLDSDDLARPRRLEEQVRFLRDHPEIAAVGSCAGKIGPDGARRRGVRVPPLAPADIRAWSLFRSPMQQSSFTGRAEILKAHPYREEYPVCEDVDVFIRLMRSHRLANLPRVLIDRRIHPDQTIRQRRDAIEERTVRLLGPELRALGMSFSDSDLRRHMLIGQPWFGGFRPDLEFLRWADGWMRRLRETNEESRHVEPEALRLATGFFWASVCRQAARAIGLAPAARAFAGSPLAAGLLSGHGRAWMREAAPVLLGRA